MYVHETVVLAKERFYQFKTRVHLSYPWPMVQQTRKLVPHGPLLSSVLWGGLLCLVACNSPSTDAPTGAGSPSVQPHTELQQVTGSFVHFGITTYGRTDCGRYEQQFSEATPFAITDQDVLRQIRQHLDALQADTLGQHTNVRAKAILRYSDHRQDTLCMGKFTSDYRGRTVRADTVLYALLGVDFKL